MRSRRGRCRSAWSRPRQEICGSPGRRRPVVLGRTTGCCSGRVMSEGNYLLPMPPSTTALVTGATHGIGRATAFALGLAGYRVGVCARTAAKVESLVAELRAAGVEAAGRAADVADPVQVTTVVE